MGEMGVAVGNGKFRGKLRQCVKLLCLAAICTSLVLYFVISEDKTLRRESQSSLNAVEVKPDTSWMTWCNGSTSEGGLSKLHPCNLLKPFFDVDGQHYLVHNEGCKLMDMHPFNPDVTPFWKDSKPPQCLKAPVKVIPGTQKIKADQSLSAKYRNSSCCYRQITRVNQDPKKYDKNADFQVKTSEDCHPIPMDGSLEVPAPIEFLRIECQDESGKQTFVGFDAIVHPPSRFTNATASKAAFWEENFIQKNKPLPPSVLVVGIDSVSRLHMYRSLNKTKAFLHSNDFVELLGYTKIGENTFPNIMAGFAGVNVDLNYTYTKHKIDLTNHIWKHFRSLNYLAGFLEDSPGIATFNYLKPGFVVPPGDYYLRPLMVADLQYNNRSRHTLTTSCVRGIPPTNFMSAYYKDFATQVSSQYPTFVYSWFTKAGHDSFNDLKIYDDEFQSLLELIIASSRENTIVIFMSDHGYRFGSFRETFLGFYEASLPFLFLRMPPSLKQSHPEWYENLRGNINRLTTPYDLYETLKDIFRFAESITTDAVGLKKDSEDLNLSQANASSLFSVGWSNRTCDESGIPQRYCICGVTPNIFKNSTLIKQFGDVIVERLNEIIEERNGTSQCAHLDYKTHLYVREVGSGEKWNNFGKMDKFNDYTMALEVSPGGGRFEGRVRHWGSGIQELTDENVGRINSYAGRSDCVTNDFFLRNYCMCNDVVEREEAERKEAEKKKAAKKEAEKKKAAEKEAEKKKAEKNAAAKQNKTG